MIPKTKLIIVDIDGCLLPKGSQTIEPSIIDRVRKYNQLSRKNAAYPPITLCSGRPEPYVELLMKLIEGYVPALFEWGGGIYLPDSYNFLYNDVFTDNVRKSRQILEDIIIKELVNKQDAKIQPGKEIAITIYPSNNISNNLLYEELKGLFEDVEVARDYTINYAQTHIDMLPVGLNKSIGIQWLADFVKIDLQKVAGIGDDESDLDFLQLVGFSACPDNAKPEVKAIVDYVSPHKNGNGVIDIIEHLVK